jgi:ribosomal protein S18 acetylase RimI-like enzyme
MSETIVNVPRESLSTEIPATKGSSVVQPRKVSCRYHTVRLSQVCEESQRVTRINEICNTAFQREVGSSYIEQFSKDTLISLATDTSDSTIWGVAFAEAKQSRSDPKYLPNEMFHIHSICVHPVAQKNGLCKGLVKSIVHQCSKQNPRASMYLNVRVTKGNPNIGGIKCYRKHGFRFVGVPPTDRDDGPNAYMVRDASSRRPTKKSRRTKRKRRPRRT